MASSEIAVVGGGIVGVAVARQLSLDGHRVVVYEKEAALARHQTGRNSGVVHSGLYYEPGSLKATLCRRGVKLLKSYCEDRGLAYREIGKLVVARRDGELDRLRELQRRAAANDVPDVAWLAPAEWRHLEPNVSGVAALHSPTTAIVDYVAVTAALACEVEEAGGELRLQTAVTAIGNANDRATITTERDTIASFDHVVVCAGLFSDRVARAAGDRVDPAILPFRGEYLRLRPEKRGIVNGLVYPVPDPAYPFLGVHFTPRIDGSVDIGPNAILAAKREGYAWRDVSASDVVEILRWPGFRRLAKKHWRAGVHEMLGSLSQRIYVARAREYVPGLALADVMPAPAGVRAQAVDLDGSLVDDFRINTLGSVTTVRNAPSPAATSSLAIAEHIVRTIGL